MVELLTAREVQKILRVDRITVYRMLNDGRLKGIKVGQQWRFARQELERLTGGELPVEEDPARPAENPFPVHCVQTIQDLFSDVSQQGALVVDADGMPVTQVSHPCKFCQAMLASPSGQEGCRSSWLRYVRSGNSTYSTCHAGLEYIGAPVVDKGERLGWFMTGQFYWQAPDPLEQDARIRRLAVQHNIPLESLRLAASSIPVIDPARRGQLETWPYSAARAIQSILRERTGFMDRLQQIATLTQIP
jgi:excisionase family DNA binding protein